MSIPAETYYLHLALLMGNLDSALSIRDLRTISRGRHLAELGSGLDRTRFSDDNDSEDKEKLGARKCKEHYKEQVGAIQHGFRALQEMAHESKIRSTSQTPFF
ncbi:hypothetical protein BX616_003306 [Lobosporangium transversale]|uniref:Uncharacterized protein n=1 Tax=Lobosporangium transversale TaxID=64571 RepID=A0A1Y2GSC2_9FUNG|nr:hypothetical protein BCR41DRAFT_394938 [Lobosporangium transversale]KAF9899077.1 hypothetical protein BX616_003306 [Lobosporangium transversale]ORZ21038.1 hypothetical protein BCR41DRAFT_394938 [Lobosporangium transversale]|eukprot:XP_021882947.1 hypothetical protein BCR41DRAFT_394938 [Lobosporangium transversale]